MLTILSAITMIKIQNVLLAYNAMERLSKRSVTIPKTMEWFILIALIAIQLSLSAITLTNQVPEIQMELNKKSLTRDVICTNHFHVQVQSIYILVLSIFSFIQGYRARNLPEYFNDVTRIIYTMLMTVCVYMCLYVFICVYMCLYVFHFLLVMDKEKIESS